MRAGMNGYALSKCLKEARRVREEAERAAQGEEGEGGAGPSGAAGSEELREQRLRYRQFIQPGTLVTLPSGGMHGGVFAWRFEVRDWRDRMHVAHAVARPPPSQNHTQ